MRNIHVLQENTYITNDEKIKEGDYGLIGNEVGKIILTEDGYEFLIGKGVSYEYGDFYSLQKVCKKIILTTDQDLDGVQAIDDEFLEWFVKNPSCEEVDIKKLKSGKYWLHKAIIPKEETKQLFTKGDKVLFSGQMLDENVVDKVVTVFYTLGRGGVDDISDIMDEYTHIYRVWNRDLKHIPKEEIHSVDDEIECNNCGNIMSLTEDGSIYVCYNSECTSCYETYEEEEPKQETVQEAAERILANNIVMVKAWLNGNKKEVIVRKK